MVVCVLLASICLFFSLCKALVAGFSVWIVYGLVFFVGCFVGVVALPAKLNDSRVADSRRLFNLLIMMIFSWFFYCVKSNRLSRSHLLRNYKIQEVEAISEKTRFRIVDPCCQQCVDDTHPYAFYDTTKKLPTASILIIA